MYENGPVILLPPPSSGSHHHHHNHHLHHHHHHKHHHRSPSSQAGAAAQQPSYQNTAYTGSDAEPDGPSTLSSAPSSAYYSDLSSNSNSATQHCGIMQIAPCTDPDAAGDDAPPIYESASHYRLQAINESSCPSDYI